ncbi:MAG: DUF2142 domain-containing protein [Verrucomicrobiota bacterium]
MNATSFHPEATERKIILLLCLFAAAHVFLFSAAFPFFNIVDEQVHFDLAVRYSQGDIPRALTPPCSEALPFIAIFGSVEYIWPPESQPGGHIETPVWKRPFNLVADTIRAKEKLWLDVVKNHEASQPPLYYSIAGAWWRLGKLLGLDGGRLLYWLRFLNIPLLAALVWLGWLAARSIFPENLFIRVAVPALVAFMPQTTFYAINNDILSPLTFGAAFVLLLKLWQMEIPSRRLAAATGLALAAAFLTKISNLPLLAVAGIFLLLKIFRLAQVGQVRPAVPAIGILAACAGLPMAGWMIWCKLNFGDFTGSVLKIQFLRWTHKPFFEWFHHPIFSPSGFWYFLKGNLSTFWQGEILWQRKPLAFPSVDLIYAALTLALFLFGLATLRKRPVIFSSTQRAAMWLAFTCLAAAFAFFALLSVKFDFQDCFYPSRAHPFFTSGRLMLGMLIPFLLLFTCSLDRALGKCRRAAKFTLLAALLVFMLAAEIAIDWRIFPNEYNWFHL